MQGKNSPQHLCAAAIVAEQQIVAEPDPISNYSFPRVAYNDVAEYEA